MKPASPVRMWAVVRRTKRTEWIIPTTLAYTRKAAWQAYLDHWLSEHWPKQEKERKAGDVRLARVTLGLEVKA